LRPSTAFPPPPTTPGMGWPGCMRMQPAWVPTRRASPWAATARAARWPRWAPSWRAMRACRWRCSCW